MSCPEIRKKNLIHSYNNFSLSLAYPGTAHIYYLGMFKVQQGLIREINTNSKTKNEIIKQICNNSKLY